MTPIERLCDFVENMLKWETEFYAKRRSQECRQDDAVRKQYNDEAKLKLGDIFGEYLSHDAMKVRAKERLDALVTGRPPEFAQRVLGETECKIGKVIYIETLNEKDLAPHRRYAIVLEDGVLKIDAVFSRLSEGEDWKKRKSI